jgi:hypothetical protein
MKSKETIEQEILDKIWDFIDKLQEKYGVEIVVNVDEIGKKRDENLKSYIVASRNH